MEIVRLANIVPGIFRKALQDVEVKGMFTHQELHAAAHGISCSPASNCYLPQVAGTELCAVFSRCLNRLYDSGRMGHHGVPTGSAPRP
jgi:hypothetical protein